MTAQRERERVALSRNQLRVTDCSTLPSTSQRLKKGPPPLPLPLPHCCVVVVVFALIRVPYNPPIRSVHILFPIIIHLTLPLTSTSPPPYMYYNMHSYIQSHSPLPGPSSSTKKTHPPNSCLPSSIFSPLVTRNPHPHTHTRALNHA